MHTFFHGWRRKATVPKIVTSVGVFVFHGRNWGAMPCLAGVNLHWLNSDFDVSAIEATRKLLGEIDQVSQEATSFAIAQGQDVWAVDSKLELESIEITDILAGRYGLTFGVSGEADTTVSVEYENGKPVEVWAAD